MQLIQEQNTTTSIGGILGNRFSTRYRIIQFLEHYYNQPFDLFYTQDIKDALKLVIDDIYNYPLFDTTKVALGQILRRNSEPSDIVDYVIELRKNGNSCR